jgi:hypothetical protein
MSKGLEKCGWRISECRPGTSRINTFDGDESPRPSGENLPHSMESTPASMECGDSPPLYAGDSSPSNLKGATLKKDAPGARQLRQKGIEWVSLRRLLGRGI